MTVGVFFSDTNPRAGTHNEKKSISMEYQSFRIGIQLYSLHTHSLAGHFRHAVSHFFTFSLHTPIFFYISKYDTHTKHHVYILPLLYLRPDLILLLHLPFEGTNLPHLVTLRLDLARTKSKNLYFIVLMDLSYTTYSVTTFCLPYS